MPGAGPANMNGVNVNGNGAGVNGMGNGQMGNNVSMNVSLPPNGKSAAAVVGGRGYGY